LLSVTGTDLSDLPQLARILLGVTGTQVCWRHLSCDSYEANGRSSGSRRRTRIKRRIKACSYSLSSCNYLHQVALHSCDDQLWAHRVAAVESEGFSDGQRTRTSGYAQSLECASHLLLGALIVDCLHKGLSLAADVRHLMGQCQCHLAMGPVLRVIA